MPVKAVKVNEEVQACRPNTCQWRAARVLENANQNQHCVVKLKFIGDTAVHTIPWAYIKVFQYAKRNSLFRSSISSLPETKVSQKVMSIDLTDLEDLDEVEETGKISFEGTGVYPIPEPAKDNVTPNGKVDYSSSITSDHGTKPKSKEPKPLSADPSSTYNSHFNDPLSPSDHDTAEQDAAFSDVVHNSKTRRNSASNCVANYCEEHKNAHVENPRKLQSADISLLNSAQDRTRVPPLETERDAAKEINKNDLHWDAITPRIEKHFRQGLEDTRTVNGEHGKPVSIRSRVSRHRTLSKPRERHPHQAVEDIPIPRARLRLNGTKPNLETKDDLNEETFSVATGLTPSKRYRSADDIQYTYTMMKPNFSDSPSYGLCRRMQKKSRRVRESYDHSIASANHSSDLTRKNLSRSEADVLGRYKSAKRFPYVSAEGAAHDDDFEELVVKTCNGMVDEHKNEVKAILQSFGSLGIKKIPPTARNHGSRKKSKPVRWADRKDTERAVFEEGTKDLLSKSQERMGLIEDIPSDLFGEFMLDGHSDTHSVRCGCQSQNLGRQIGLLGRATIQCGQCGYWSHVECVGLDEMSVVELRGRDSVTKKHFICTFCVNDATDGRFDSLTAFEPEEAGQRNLSSSSAAAVSGRLPGPASERQWQSHVSPVVLGQPQTERRVSRPSRKILNATIPSSGSRHRPRPPLSEAEILARAKNVEFLRSGVLKPSVGLKERELVDDKIFNFNM
ncbi:unnamed protein product [Agarophyton chilense]|eukprot:gb/GEZJ01002512.1/.p1 GENE.gb/GEZJ01002512.1/~~gb/GEZJ01002512.1/.p1  ORF type:complete len:733 (-),score=81.87 gb/GEZJ01002512.1/:1122-3320(-)